MEYLVIEDWELIRNVIGILICIVSILCLRHRRVDFHSALKDELSGKNLKAVRKQVLRLREENRKADQLLSSFAKAPGLIKNDLIKEIHVYEPDMDDDIENCLPLPENSTLRSVPVAREVKQDPYQLVRRYVESGINREKIYERMDLPKAEIDLMLKFDRLSKMSRPREGAEQRRRACG